MICKNFANKISIVMAAVMLLIQGLDGDLVFRFNEDK